MNKKMTKTILLVLLLVLFIGITSVTAVSDNTTDNKVVKDTNNAPNVEIQSSEKTMNKKTIKKDNKIESTENNVVSTENKININKNKSNQNSKKEDYVVTIGPNYWEGGYNGLYTVVWQSANYYDRGHLVINLKTGTYTADNSALTLFCSGKTSTITINGNGATIFGSITGRVNNFAYVGEGHTLILNDITFKNFYTSYTVSNNGAVIAGSGNIIISNCVFESNHAQDKGGVIQNNYGNIKITDSTFTSNTASTDGGVIYSTGTVEISNSTFASNIASNSGGVIFSTGTVEIIDSKFISNSANVLSGGIRANKANITSCLFENNGANNGWGGAMIVLGTGEVNVTNSTFNNNFAGQNGGAIHIEGQDSKTSNAIIENSTFNNNNAGQNGGAIYSYGEKQATISIKNATFENNLAGINGGAILSFAGNNNSLKIVNSTFKSNSARNNGGAIYTSKNNYLRIKDNNFTNNTASNFGGAIQCDSTLSNANIISNTFNINSANDGGSIYFNNITNLGLNLTNNKFTNNTANHDAGAIYFNNTDNIIINENRFLSNHANENGGSIYYNNTANKHNITKNNFTNNSADAFGGAILIKNATNFILADNNFISNQVLEQGGATFIQNMTNSSFKNNKFTSNFASRDGGAITSCGLTEQTKLENNEFKSNRADYNGGAIYYEVAITKHDITKNKFINNTANDQGGALYYTNTINNSKIIKNEFINNTAREGGAVYYNNKLTNISIEENKYINNNASENGGALTINSFSNKTTIKKNTFNNNHANEYGGAINCVKASNMEIMDNTFNNNTSNQQGGAINCPDDMDNMKIIRNTFTKNTAQRDGGAINYNSIISNTIITNNSFNNNIAKDYDGGAIHLTTLDNTNITKNTFTTNVANDEGGAIYIHSYESTNSNLNNNIFTNNNATKGAAIYNNGNLKITYNTFNRNLAKEVADTGIISNNEEAIIKDNINDTTTPYTNTIFNDGYQATITNNIFQGTPNIIYVTSNGKGDGKTINNPTNITNALKIVNNKEIIKLISPTGTDTYNDQIIINSNTVKNNTKQFSIIGEENKKIILSKGLTTHDVDLTLNNLIFEGKNASLTGSNFKISNSKFANNYDTSGASIYATGEATISNNIFTNNYVSNNGGSIYSSGDNVKILNNTFKNNTAKRGGAIYNTGSNILIENNTFSNNEAEYGGAIYTSGNNVNIRNNKFELNTARNNGSAIFFNGSSTTKSVSYRVDEGHYEYIRDSGSDYISNIYDGNGRDVTPTRRVWISKWVTHYRDETVKTGTGMTITGNVFRLNTVNSNNSAIESTYPFDNINNTNVNLTKAHSTIYGTAPDINSISNNKFDDTKINTKISLSISNNIPQVTNTITITAKLTDVTNNALSNQTVILNIDGKTYSIKINNNGIITQTYTLTTTGSKQITVNYGGNNIYTPCSTSTKITANKMNTKLTIKASNPNVNVNTAVTLTATLTDANNKVLANQAVTLIVDAKTYSLKTNNNGVVSQIHTFTKAGSFDIKANFIGTALYNPSSGSTKVTVTNNNPVTSKLKTKITLNPVKGVIGETITLKATLTDANGKAISGGNLAFKLNGKTLRSDGRFDSKASAMKFSVKNGIVTYTIKADLYLRNAKNLTASYSGTSTYAETTSPSVTAQIQKRYAQVTVTSTPTRAKQYETLTFKVTAKDVTKNGKNNTLISTNTKVMLKVNGVTLKDSKGKILYVTLDKNAQATYKYTIPAGTGGITTNKKARNYTVTAIFIGDNYYPGAKNTTKFQVERSATYINITQAKVTKTNLLSVKATLKDYKGKNLIGTNKVTIKINGKNYVDPKNGKAKYWSVKNGVVDLSSIQVDPKTTIKRVMLVTGERQAYHEGRKETTNIQKV